MVVDDWVWGFAELVVDYSAGRIDDCNAGEFEAAGSGGDHLAVEGEEGIEGRERG